MQSILNLTCKEKNMSVNKKDIFASVQCFSTKNFDIRFIKQDDCEALLKVYSDKKSQPIFNSDNCHGDDFCYETIDRMNSAMKFWFESYEKRYFVRYAIVDRQTNTAIGTVELFTRFADDHFNNCIIMRADLLSRYERKEYIRELALIFIEHAKEYYEGQMIATKAISSAEDRISALLSLGFRKSDFSLIGFDGTEYNEYYEYNL